MPLADLTAQLRIDLADPESKQFTDEVLGRCVQKGVFTLARDLDIPLGLVNGEPSPEPEGETRELLLILGQIHACQLMRAATANAFSFSSGDKRVDKSGQSANWAKLESDLQATYRARLAALRPDVASTENYMITPDVQPVIYEQGKWYHHHHAHRT